MAPALVALIPSKATRSSSSSRSSTPQAKAPCAPPPWRARFTMLTALPASGPGSRPAEFPARTAPRHERAPFFLAPKPRALTAPLIAHPPNHLGGCHPTLAFAALPVLGQCRRLWSSWRLGHGVEQLKMLS